MGLNAVVYCDCVEKGRLTRPHPRPDQLFIDERGAPDISSDDPRDIEAHDRWESLRPCEHERFWLIECWLGNVSVIGSIRAMRFSWWTWSDSDPTADAERETAKRGSTAQPIES